ncbi:hypothetical protein DL93DRAFT_2083372, partial [Clavulina sp. PMI_390]
MVDSQIPQFSFYHIEDSHNITHVGSISDLVPPVEGENVWFSLQNLDSWTPPSPDRTSYLEITYFQGSKSILLRMSSLGFENPEADSIHLPAGLLQVVGSQIPHFRKYCPLPGGLGLLGWPEWVEPEEPTQ